MVRVGIKSRVCYGRIIVGLYLELGNVRVGVGYG